jgi:hypothetical protein
VAEEGGRYARILLWVFRNRGEHDPASGDFLFAQQDIRDGAAALGVDVRNFPDLTYYLRSRVRQLPPEIADAGYTTIAMRGQGQYALVTGEDKIIVPAGTEVVTVPLDPIPEAIRDLFRQDEQSVLSVVRHLDLVTDFIGAKAYHIQGHLRTTGSRRQQVEADDIWAAPDLEGQRTMLPIEAKGIRERLGRNQMISTVDAVRVKHPSLPVAPLAVQLLPEGLLLFVRFAYQTSPTGLISTIDPVRFKRYALTPRLPLWP